jgi:hypothetical protein
VVYITPKVVYTTLGMRTRVAQVLARGLEKRVEKRYASVDEMATDLYGCLVRPIHRLIDKLNPLKSH